MQEQEVTALKMVSLSVTDKTIKRSLKEKL
jgi:hypothetical protein